MLFGFFNFLRAIPDPSLVKVASSGASIPPEGPGAVSKKSFLISLFLLIQGTNCSTFVVMLMARIREACGS